MNAQNASFNRKIAYIATIAILLIPLSWLSQPATNQAGASSQKSGGKLAQLRAEHSLAQANLGEIDPASETMKLATLGLQGVAVLWLWEKANEAKKMEDWDTASATINQIIKLQPNFIKVWEFQAHNLSYNMSVAFDDYKYRYHWVKKGIYFLIEGTKYNSREPKMPWWLGFFTGQKIGRSDERVQFREMYRNDDDFHKLLYDENLDIDAARDPYNRVDNWLTARQWYLRCYELIDAGAVFRGKGPLIYYSDAPMSRVNFALSHDVENNPGEGEIPRENWTLASQSWQAFGDRQIRTTWGTYVRLNSLQEAEDRVDTLQAKFDKMLGDVRVKLKKEMIASFPKDIRDVFDKPKDERDEGDEHIFKEWTARIRFSNNEIASAAPKDLQREARNLAEELNRAQVHLRRTDGYRTTINFPFWMQRCEAERSHHGIEARKNMYRAHQHYLATRLVASTKIGEDGKIVYETKKDENGHTVYELDEEGKQKPDKNGEKIAVYKLGEDGKKIAEMEPGAKETYEAAWDHWNKLFKEYDQMECRTVAEEMAPRIVEYRDILMQQDMDLSIDFPLMGILDIRNGQDRLPTSSAIKENHEKEQAAKKEAAAKAEAEEVKKAESGEDANSKPDDATDE